MRSGLCGRDRSLRPAVLALVALFLVFDYTPIDLWVQDRLFDFARGAHFLSHTVVTALVCWIVFLAWRRVLRATEPEAAVQPPFRRMAGE